MSFEIIMPVLGMNQDTGIIAQWLKKPGEWVSSGDAVLSVETDKAVQDIETRHEGYLSHVKYEEGAEVPVGDVIAQLTATPETSAAPATAAATPPAASVAIEPVVEQSVAAPAPAAPLVQAPKAVVPVQQSSTGKILASPKAKALAVERNIALADVVTSGIAQPLHAQDVVNYVPPKAMTKSRSKVSVKVNPDALVKMEQWLGGEGFSIARAELLAVMTAGALRFTQAIEADSDCYISLAADGTSILNPDRAGLSGIALETSEVDSTVSLWDFTDSPIASFSDENHAGISIAFFGQAEWTVDLNYDSEVINAKQAVALLSELVLRFSQPLRQLL